ncbi:unnamed protein product [Peronospora destructor]|uniref:Uncharacterized protein n=1 Tax=Peronospora destructor TaxID=86335 RepID=A0AAV0V4F5_9STRA|nr:unnamed protein product [Peronospora destructor]
MTSAVELRAQNERMMLEIDALRSAKMTLDKEVKELTLECDELQLAGSKKVQMLEQKLETVDEELTSLRLQCQSIIEVVKNADTENKVEAEEDSTPVSVRRKLSAVVNQTLQRAKGVSMPEHRRASTVEMVAYALPSCRTRGARLVPRRVCSFQHDSHYGNFRRRSPYRKNRDSVMVL